MNFPTVALASALLVGLPGLACAQQAQTARTAGAAPPAAAQATSRFDEVWGAARLHRGGGGDALNELRLVGRFHLDQYVLDADQGEDSDLVVRRARLGAAARMFDRLEANVQAELNLEGGGPVYNRLTDAYVAWTFSDKAKLFVGKHSAEFTLDGASSSNSLLTIDRSNVANNFWFTEEYLPGVSLKGKIGRNFYNVGAFSGGRNDGEFGDFEGGYVFLASAGREFPKLLGTKSVTARLDYVYNEPDPRSTFTRPYEHVAAVVVKAEGRRWGAAGDVVIGKGFPGRQSDGVGATAMSWFNVSDRLVLVSRYSFLKSDDPNGLRLARYENTVSSGRGDRYHELYAGLNWLIYGHKLKLQSGVTYANMRDRANDGGAYDGFAWTNALRVSW